MTVQEAYEAYRIPPILQLHQLRVGAIGKMAAESLSDPIDTRSVILACLFHDMGNIIKFDLGQFPESLEPEGLDFWQHVKDDFLQRFGDDEHHATIEIAHELHLPLQVIRYIESVGFSKLKHIAENPSMEQKIVEYADTRVGPYGVLPMHERLEEARLRYAKRRSDIPDDRAHYEELAGAARLIEEQIFAKSRITPVDITESTVQPLLDELRDFPLT